MLKVSTRQCPTPTFATEHTFSFKASKPVKPYKVGLEHALTIMPVFQNAGIGLMRSLRVGAFATIRFRRRNGSALGMLTHPKVPEIYSFASCLFATGSVTKGLPGYMCRRQTLFWRRGSAMKAHC